MYGKGGTPGMVVDQVGQAGEGSGTHEATSEQVTIAEMGEYLDDDLDGEEVQHDGRGQGLARDLMRHCATISHSRSTPPSFTSTFNVAAAAAYKGALLLSPSTSLTHIVCPLVLPRGYREANWLAGRAWRRIGNN